MKINDKYKEAAQFLSSLRLAYAEVRLLQNSEIDFILKRAKELSIPNVKEYIEHIKNNKKTINRTPKKNIGGKAMTTKELEYAIYKKYFNASKLTITNIKTVVKHECDVAVIGKSNYLTGFELKISKSDLLADFKKKHTHICKKIKKFYYVLPKSLENCVDLIPGEFGVIIVTKGSYIDDFCLKTPLEKTKYNCRIVRESKVNKTAEKITVDEYINLCRLASMRVWTHKMNELKNEDLIQWNKAKVCDTCKHQEKKGKHPVVIECRECRSFNNWEDKE